MAIDISLELDSGPITWVKDEIDTALMRALETIQTLKSNPGAEGAEAVRVELHQVAGALELVGLDGLAAVVQEFEKHFAADAQPISAEALNAVDKGCRRLIAHLNEVASGATAVPLRFADEYVTLGKLRGVTYGSADLFFPDLSRRPPRLENAVPPEPARMAPFLTRHRRDYQQGLLNWLRGNEAGLATMRTAISNVESAYPLPSQRSFWWATHALLEAAEAGRVELGPGLKQLLARVDLQLRRLVEGSTKVADRLRREVLYQVACAESGGPLVDAVKELYELNQLVPRRASREIDLVALRPVLESIKQARQRCEDAWAGLTSGRGNAVDQLKEATTALTTACRATRMAEFVDLSTALAETAAQMVQGQAVADSLTNEFAACLYLLQTAVDRISALPPTFRAQVDNAIQRLRHAREGTAIPDALQDAAMDAQSLTRQAQDRETVAQVAREIRTNLRQIEQALDALFRDRSAVDELKPVPGLLKQVTGAMTMLSWTEAASLLDESASKLVTSLGTDEVLPDAQIELFADVLAGLSFYVDVRERDDKHADQLLDNLRSRLAGEQPAAPETAAEDKSIEASLDERKRALRTLVVAKPIDQMDAAEVQAVRGCVASVQQDADLMEDEALVARCNEALSKIDQGQYKNQAFVDLLSTIIGETAAIPPISEETNRLLQTAPVAQDDALLDVFIEEAQELLVTIKPLNQDLQGDPGNRNALLDIRRAFHTFKGSGRMVGLTALGEVAFKVEKTLNGVIESERRLNQAELTLIDRAIGVFTQWVSELSATQRADVDETALDAYVEACQPQQAQTAPTLPPVEAKAEPVAEPEVSPPVIEVPPLAEPTIDIPEIELPTALEPEPATPERLELPPTDPVPVVEPAIEPTIELTAEPTTEWASALASPLEVPPPAEPPVVEVPDLMPALTAPTASEAPPEPTTLNVLGVEISSTLFAILTEEAWAHLRTIENELITMQFDPRQLPSETLVRASHTLCGIHRTAGFTDVGELAGTLERVLIAVQRHGRDGVRLETLVSAHRVLRNVWLRLREQSALTTEEQAEFDDVQRQLSEMLNTLTSDQLPAVDLSGLTMDDLTQDDALFEVSAAPEAAPAVPEVTESMDLAGLSADALDIPGFFDAPGTQPVSPPAGDAQAAQLLNEAIIDLSAPQPADAPEATATDADESPAPAEAQPPSAPDTQAAPALTTAFVPAMVMPTLQDASALLNTETEVVPAGEEAASDDPLAEVRDDLDTQVLSIFLEEAQELFPLANQQLHSWKGNTGSSAAHVDGLKRTLHTVKGSARMAGAMRLGEVAHQMETFIMEQGGDPTPAFFERAQEYLDDIGYLLDALGRGESNTVLPRYVQAPAAQPGEGAAVAADNTGTAAAAPVNPAVQTAPVVNEAPQAVPAAGVAPVAADTGSTMLRVRSDAVEVLSDEAGEIAISRSRIEGEVRNIKAGMADLSSAVVRLRAQLREIEIQGESQIQSKLDQQSSGFDPLEFDRFTRFQELTRGLAEAVNDVATVQQGLSKSLLDAETALAVQTRLSRSVQLRLQSLRTVPFSSVSDRLYRVLRQTAKELGKRANLDVQGGKVQIDRSVLERLSPVLEHLVRNALAHGIESADLRQLHAKPPIGELTLSVEQQGSEVVIALKDDGAGVPLDKVRQRALQRGIITPDETVTDAQLLDLIFHPGFSTSEQVTAVAGRGVGMDVVRNEVKTLGGRVDVSTQAGSGTVFTLTVPLSLTVTQVTLVGAGESVFGISSTLVDRVRQLTLEEHDAAANTGSLWHEGRAVPYRSLNTLLQMPEDLAPQNAHSVSVMLLRSGNTTLALEVSQVIGSQEVVSKPYGPQLSRVPGLTGLTVLADGTIALLLNPINLLHTSTSLLRAAAIAAAERQASSAQAASLLALPPDTLFTGSEDADAAATATAAEAPPAARPTNVVPLRRKAVVAPTVLVVDDSLTVRKITTRLLEREGYVAMTAKDGVDALQVLAETIPAVMLLDIEMPRMDGFELTKAMKADERLRDIPIIMITSRTAEKHRNVAMELGVSEYLGKPYQDEQLLALIKSYVQESAEG